MWRFAGLITKTKQLVCVPAGERLEREALIEEHVGRRRRERLRDVGANSDREGDRRLPQLVTELTEQRLRLLDRQIISEHQCVLWCLTQPAYLPCRPERIFRSRRRRPLDP